MIRTGESLQERRARHMKEYLQELRGLPEASARIQANFYFRSHGLINAIWNRQVGPKR